MTCHIDHPPEGSPASCGPADHTYMEDTCDHGEYCRVCGVLSPRNEAEEVYLNQMTPGKGH